MDKQGVVSAPSLRIGAFSAVIASFALAALIVALGWLAVVAGPGSDDVTLALADAQLTAGRPQTGTRPGLRLDENGRALLRFAVDGIEVDGLSMLEIDADVPSPRGRLIVFAAMQGDAEPRSIGIVDGLPEGRPVLYLGSVDAWSGSLRELLLAFEGPPGAPLEFRELRLSSPSVATVFANAVQFWLRAEPWSLSSINAPLERSVLSVAAPWTALLAIAALGIALASLAVTALPRLAPAAPARSALTLGGSLFLLCWILLDLVWLDRQRVNTLQAIDRFGSRGTEARPLAGPDASLVLLARRIDRIIERTGAGRIFVASSSDFLGMRAAYQLYPRNVYWERHAELPSPDRLRGGDYVLLMLPTQHTVADGTLLFPEHPGAARAVAVLLETPNARFLRVD